MSHSPGAAASAVSHPLPLLPPALLPSSQSPQWPPSFLSSAVGCLRPRLLSLSLPSVGSWGQESTEHTGVHTPITGRAPPPTQLSSLPIHFRDVATHLLSTTQAGQWGACPPAPPWLTGAPYRAQSPGWKVPRMLMGSRGVGWGALWSLGGCWVKVRGARAHPDASFQSISLWPGSWGVWEGAHHSDREFCIQPPGVCSPAVSFLRA